MNQSQLAAVAQTLAGGTPGIWEIDPDGVNDHIHRVGPVAGYDGDSLDIGEANAEKLRLWSALAPHWHALAQAVEAMRDDWIEPFPSDEGAMVACHICDESWPTDEDSEHLTDCPFSALDALSAAVADAVGDAS